MIDLFDGPTTMIDDSIETLVSTDEIIELIPGVGPILIGIDGENDLE
jgi:hypothetical protein